jgi:hypothetical protein
LFDVEIQNHVKSVFLDWPRARKVQIYAEWVKCELDYQRAYRFMDAYSDEPHIKFLDLKSQDKLAAFVQKWGPLRIPDTSPKTTSWMQTDWYWNFQRELKATANLLRAFCARDGEKEALAEFLGVKKQHPGPTTEELLLAMSVPNDRCLQDAAKSDDPDKLLIEWNGKADTRSRHQAIAGLVEKTFSMTARMSGDWQSRPPRIEVVWELNDLEAALTWMVFQDAVTERFPQVCPECQSVFRSTTRHERKFCSYECAHRAAARGYWRRNLRAKKDRLARER